VDTGVTKYLLSEFGAVLALGAVITAWLFSRLDRRHPALATQNPRSPEVGRESMSAEALPL
jgi:hypothetical protein